MVNDGRSYAYYYYGCECFKINNGVYKNIVRIYDYLKLLMVVWVAV